MRSHTKCGPNRFSRFDVYWTQTTNRHPKRQSIYLEFNQLTLNISGPRLLINSRVSKIPIGIPFRAIARNACFRLRHFIAWNCAKIAKGEAIKFLRNCAQQNCFASKNICRGAEPDKRICPLYKVL